MHGSLVLVLALGVSVGFGMYNGSRFGGSLVIVVSGCRSSFSL